MKATKKRCKILVVDDNSKNIQIVGNILRASGYSVGFALDGSQALTLLQENNDYHLVLLDVNMPGLNGFETCIALRKNKKLKEIPVLFLTALNETSDIVKGFEAGGQDFITKPFNSEELLSRVKTHLELKYSKDKLADANLHLEKKVIKRTKELNKAKLKAEESDRLKSTFLALMNHEIRTPLNAIVGFSTIIAESNQDVNSLKFSKIIQKQTDLLLKLVDDIIDSAQIESGAIHISNEIFDLNELLNKLLVNFEAKSPSGISLIPNKPLKEIFVNADKSRVKQIFTNLILNAIKFTPEGTITFGYDFNKESELICFVKDTGIGISSENHHKIFERFTKLDSFSQGTGLGLSIVKNIVDLMEGKIWIESELEKGATFYFKLPFTIVKLTGQKTVSKKVIPDSAKKFTILIAEDEESNFIYLNELLDADNFNVIHALNGKEAVDLCAKNKEIGLVLMDINMPVLNGYEATKQIKKINPELPIVAQTAYNMPENKEAAKEAGFDGFLSKPIRKSDLFEWIRIFS